MSPEKKLSIRSRKSWIKYRQPENRQGVVGKLCEYGYIRYSKSLKTAHLVGIANEYVANKIKRPKTKEKQIECFSCQEQKKIENYVLNNGKDKLFGVVLCLYTGLRIGELLALTWDDIDFGKGLLFVSKTCHDGNDGKNHIRIIDSPKTVHSRRVIPLPKQILSLLKGINILDFWGRLS